MRRHLTYANVVSTLCLFVLLGGAAHAAGLINGKRLQNRTVGAKKIKRNSLGGAEVRESRLKRVPRASDAEALDGFDSTQFLKTGGKAPDAEALDGLDSPAFLRSGRIQFAGANPEGTARLLASLPDLGVSVLTDGDGDSSFDVTFRRDTPGFPVLIVKSNAPGTNELVSGETETVSVAGADVASFVLKLGVDGPGALLHCGRSSSAPVISCFTFTSG